ncbi:HNH endonuclease family protein [Hydrogenobaculum acidophilum]
MINIDFRKYTEEFKEAYYNFFAKGIKNEKYFSNSEPSNLEYEIRNLEILILKIIKRKKILTKRQMKINIITKIIESILNNLTVILTGDIKSLLTFYREIENLLNELQSIDKNIYKFLMKKLRKEFDKIYENKIGKDGIGYTLTKILDARVCPYCNEQYTYTIEEMENNNIKLRPELDHFLPKSKFPIFAISLGNLIPSCSICNKKKSNNYNDELKSPFQIDSYNDFKFTFITDIYLNALTSIKLTNIEDNIEIDFKNSIEENRRIFLLKERYQYHKDVVAEIILKTKLINEAKIKIDDNLLNLEDKYRLLYCNYFPTTESEFLKRPLSKLIYDIYMELDISSEKLSLLN